MCTVKGFKMVATALLVGGLFAGTVKASEGSHWWEDLESQVELCKDEFVFGEPVCVRVQLTNQHAKLLRVRNRRGRYFEFTGQDALGKSIEEQKESQMSAWSSYVEVPPGADFNDVVFLNRYLIFPDPSQYTVSYKGCVEVQHPTGRGDDPNTHAIWLSGVVRFRLREGSPGELEKTLREYVKALKGDNRRLQNAAARGLAVSQPKLAVKLLKECVDESSQEYAPYTSDAVWALARIRNAEAIQALLDLAASSGHCMARGDAIRALGRFRVKEALPTLISLLYDSDARIRVSSLRSLGDLGEASVTAEVKLRCNDPDPKVRDVARKVYQKLRTAEVSPEQNQGAQTQQL